MAASGAAGHVTAWDTETCLFSPGRMAPPIVCVSWQRPEIQPTLVRYDDAHDVVQEFLRDDISVGAFMAYDMAVSAAQWPDLLPDIFRAYDEDRVTDVQIRQKLLDIAAGCYRKKLDGDVWIKLDYNLAAITKRLTGRVLDKTQWRTGCEALRDVPIAQWPDGARVYAMDDARATLDCFLSQQEHAKYLEPQFHEARASLWLHFMSAWGLRTDADRVAKLEKETFTKRGEILQELVAKGLVRPNGSRNLNNAKAWMEQSCKALGKPVRYTKTGQIALDSDSCEYSGDEIMESYGEYATLNKVLTNDIPALAKGTVTPVHSRFDLAGSGRTTSSNPNVQNWRRLTGIRECFVPRPGMVFADADYNALELWSLAQCCIYLFGKSKLADVLNSGEDPHTLLAAQILKISPEEAKRRKEDLTDQEFFLARQTAKVGNFGLPCGMSAKTFVHFAKKSYHTVITPEDAVFIKNSWLELWADDMQPYFAHIRDLMNNPDNLGMVEIPMTHMLRAGCTYTETANTYYQGLGAAAAKEAGWLISKATYLERDSVLYGSRTVNFVHDQFQVETPDTPNAHDAAMELARLMQAGARKYMPDCVPGVQPLLCRFWSKDAKAIFDAQGRLTPWPNKD